MAARPISWAGSPTASMTALTAHFHTPGGSATSSCPIICSTRYDAKVACLIPKETTDESDSPLPFTLTGLLDTCLIYVLTIAVADSASFELSRNA